MSLRGTLLFARYAYPPNELGYCGPQGAAALLRPDAPAEIARRARRFEGAWSYLEFIAASAGIADPLDEAVVEAYWIGNELLDGVSAPDLVAWLGERFHGQPGGTWRTAGARATAHHSFQVFEVYPWAGLLTAPAGPVAVSVLDRCRIRAGVVLDVRGESATVRSRPLVWDGAELTPGPPREEVAAWSAGGRSLLGGLSPGDRVALHWDWVCDVITGEQQERIESLELRRRRCLTAPAG
ncbi:DUF6390 family protein [Actinoplanes sp. NPDC049668]|uniref:DUF6390 family protein n=1 Tax=unclassified Actinoplanes TaxID=2626549 RepID=UPI0033B05AAC